AAPMIPKIILANSGWRCPVVGKNVDGTPQKLPHQAGKCTHVLKMLTKNSYRTEIIANFVKQAYDAGRNTVVFSELKEAYIPLLKAAFIKTGIPVKDIGMYVGGMKEDALSKASAKPVVLTTYRMTAKAVDCPWWDTAVFATPRSDVIQIAGRILREYEGKVCARSGTEGRVPVIFDVVDYDSPVFKQYFKGRGKYYRKIGAPMAGDTALLNSL
ncbi:MAG: hypothetical protein OEX12_14245, partial [Gammaproteobacteria bacterium]|nr:hypothetical protein [Gammaproteobacteria bacterium]